jgi:hypothetical protein
VRAMAPRVAALLAASAIFAACDLDPSSSSAAPVDASDSVAGPQRAGTGAATLVWSPPTSNTNGTMLTNLGGYKIYYGPDISTLTEVIDINNPGTTSYIVDQLVSGTYYFALSAYNAAGVESAMKIVGSKTIL